MIYYIILYYIMLYYIILYYIVLYYIIVYYIILYYIYIYIIYIILYIYIIIYYIIYIYVRFSSLIPPTLQGAHTITCFTINTTSRGPCTALLADVARVPSLYPAGFRLHEENPGVLGEPDFFCKRMLVFQARGQINVTV